jgi:hypothetical protein
VKKRVRSTGYGVAQLKGAALLRWGCGVAHLIGCGMAQ